MRVHGHQKGYIVNAWMQYVDLADGCPKRLLDRFWNAGHPQQARGMCLTYFGSDEPVNIAPEVLLGCKCRADFEALYELELAILNVRGSA